MQHLYTQNVPTAQNTSEETPTMLHEYGNITIPASFRDTLCSHLRAAHDALTSRTTPADRERLAEVLWQLARQLDAVPSAD